jgi:adenine-specific DNA-methyltransferase
MAKKSKPSKRPIEHYDHKGKTRPNNPPVGLVTPQTDPDEPKKQYQYDPHLDPQLVWSGKAEHTSFHVPTVSLHVHERIDPRTIVRAVQRRNGNGLRQGSLFESAGENPPLREAIEFYRHAHGWSNRLVAGDSLLVMNSLLEKEGMAGKVQMIYIDPPYGIKYGSNFQPFVNKRDVKDGNDQDLTQEPEMIRAFRDTWELGIHSYLTYLRDRLVVARELLTDTGSVFVQIGDENAHLVRCLLDEVFGESNFCSMVTVAKTSGASSPTAKTLVLATVCDYIMWYAKDKERIKYRQLFREKSLDQESLSRYRFVQEPNGTRRSLTTQERENPEVVSRLDRVYRRSGTSSQTRGKDAPLPFAFGGKSFRPEANRGWSTTLEGLSRLEISNRLEVEGNSLCYVRFLDDFPAAPISNVWQDVGGGVQSRSDPKIYVVQTGTGPVQRCLLMTTDPGDLVFDPTCGSGTTALVAEQWGRRWITCDTSRVAIALAKQRLMTAAFDYYRLAHPDEGVGSGFVYKTVPHVTLKSIANNPEIREGMTPPQIDAAIAKYAEQETLYDQPEVDRSKVRVTGPFTVEAVPAPAVLPVTSGEWLVASEEDQPLATSTKRFFVGLALTSAADRDILPWPDIG